MFTKTNTIIRRAAVRLGHAAIAAMLLLSVAPGAMAEDFYAGKQITFIVGAGVGDKAKIEIGFVPGEEVDKVVKLNASTPPDIAERYTKALAPENK